MQLQNTIDLSAVQSTVKHVLTSSNVILRNLRAYSIDHQGLKALNTLFIAILVGRSYLVLIMMLILC